MTEHSEHSAPCKDFFGCPLAQSDTAHRTSFLHACPFGASCPDRESKDHSAHFYHLKLPVCPNGKDCPFLIDLEHRITYHHPGERDFLFPCPQGRRCTERRDPQHTSMYQHSSEPMYPSIPDDLKSEIRILCKNEVESEANSGKESDKCNDLIDLVDEEENEEENNDENDGEEDENENEEDEDEEDDDENEEEGEEKNENEDDEEEEIDENEDDEEEEIDENEENEDDVEIEDDENEEEEEEEEENEEENDGEEEDAEIEDDENENVEDNEEEDERDENESDENKVEKNEDFVMSDKDEKNNEDSETKPKSLKRKRSSSPVKPSEKGSNKNKESQTTKSGNKKLSSKDIQDIMETIDAEACARDIEPAAQLKGMTTQLHDFQLQALSWMKMREEKGNGGILCDESGLGKTVEMISLIVSSQRRPTLVITLPPLLEYWGRELSAHVKKEHELKACTYNESFRKEHSKKGNSEKIFMEYDVVLADFLSVAEDWESNGPILKKAWYRVVVDDAHAIKALKANFFVMLSELKARKRWCVTDTPIQSSLNDLRDLVFLVEPDPESKVHTAKKFEGCIAKPFMDGGNIPDDLKSFVRTYFIRRTRATTTEEGKPLIPLPQCHLEDVSVAMSSIHRSFYSKVEELVLSAIKRCYSKSRMEQVFILMLRLRQCADHPFVALRSVGSKDPHRWDYEALFKRFSDVMYSGKMNLLDADDELSDIVASLNEFKLTLPPEKRFKEEKEEEEEEEEEMDDDILKDTFDGDDSEPQLTLSSSSSTGSMLLSDEDDEGDIVSKIIFHADECKKELGEPTGDGILAVSPKIDEIIKIVRRHTEDDPASKFAVFSCFDSFLDLIQTRIRHEGIPVCRVNNSSDSTSREAAVKEFKGSSGPVVMLANHVLPGASLSLTCANVVIISDPWWNPAVDFHAVQQVHKIGQDKDVHAYRLFTRDTMDERMKGVMEKTIFGRNAEGMHIQICELMEELVMSLTKQHS